MPSTNGVVDVANITDHSRQHQVPIIAKDNTIDSNHCKEGNVNTPNILTSAMNSNGQTNNNR